MKIDSKEKLDLFDFENAYAQVCNVKGIKGTETGRKNMNQL